MKYLLITAAAFLLLVMPLCNARGQATYKKHELYFGVGILSEDQLKGFSTEEKVNAYMSFPKVMTGAQFLGYRYRITKCFSVGATVGMDIQTGDLSYGDEHHGSLGGYHPGESGRYGRYAYTFAAEAALAYVRKKDFRVSGYAGWGYSIAFDKYTFFQGIYQQDYFYGTANSLVPTNPYTLHRGHYTYQITPISFRFGGKVAGFFDIGYGYKGLFSGGVTARI